MGKIKVKYKMTQIMFNFFVVDFFISLNMYNVLSLIHSHISFI